MRTSIQVKLLAAFGIIAALMLTVGLFSLARLRGENTHLSVLAGTVVPSTRAVGDINALMNKYRKDQLHYIVARPADRPLSAPGSIAGDLAEDLSLMHGDLHSYRANGLIEDRSDRAFANLFEREFARYVHLTAAFAPIADQGKRDLASAVVGDGAGDAAWNALKGLISAWSNHKVENAHRAEAASHATYSTSVDLITALLLGALALAIGVAVLMARRMTTTVRQIGTAARAIARGDIDQRVDVKSRDEFGAMAEHFDSMVDYLRGTVRVAEAVADGDLGVDVRPRSQRDALGNALVRMTRSLRELASDNQRLLDASRREAHTDPLTGLANRRALMRDLETHIGAAGTEQKLLLALFDLNGFKQYNDTFGHPSGDALLTRLGGRLDAATEGAARAYRMGGDEFCVLAVADARVGAALARRAAAALSEVGEAFRIDCSYGVVHLPEEASSASDALRVADQRMYEHKAGRASAVRQSSDVLRKVLDEHSPGMHAHIGEVAQLARMTAEKLGLPEFEVQRITLAAELHDIGKVAIPHAILNKAGALDDEEWSFMRRHCEVGERIVAAAPALAQTAELVRSHHERYDGRGYPDRLRGEQIPLGACVIAVCDSFSAMTSRRPYSDAMSVADALSELRRCSGSQFSPAVVEAFCDLIEPDERPPRAEARPGEHDTPAAPASAAATAIAPAPEGSARAAGPAPAGGPALG